MYLALIYSILAFLSKGRNQPEDYLRGLPTGNIDQADIVKDRCIEMVTRGLDLIVIWAHPHYLSESSVRQIQVVILVTEAFLLRAQGLKLSIPLLLLCTEVVISAVRYVRHRRETDRRIQELQNELNEIEELQEVIRRRLEPYDRRVREAERRRARRDERTRRRLQDSP